jgi:formylglycine-generating enzyme required for sulfatase activity
MGASDSEEDERPVHRVFLSEFFIGRFPVTQDEYARFVNATGHPAPTTEELPRIAGGGRERLFLEMATPYQWRDGQPPAFYGSHPVVLVGFEDAQAYCRWLGDQLSRDVRLPTEAEWEKSARGGLEGRRYPWGDEIDTGRANFLPDLRMKRHRGTRPTGTYAPNAFGLYDIIGNVWEWVSDWYGAEYYGISETRDPRGPAGGMLRIVRGGSWVNHDVTQLRCAYRHKVPPDTYAYSIGFRIACSA